MKTISEMQLLVKEAYSKLDELSKSLNEYNVSTKSGDVTVDFEKLKTMGKRNPITGHVLHKADQLIKKHYITLLIALAYLAEENQERGWLLIQRIACGAGVEHDLVDLSGDALNLTEKQMDTFSESIISGNLRTAFAMDCMLVYMSCEHRNKKMLEFSSQLMELVNCTEVEVKATAKLANIIAEQDKKAYFEYCLTDMPINLTNSLCYIMPIQATVVNSIEEAMTIEMEHVIVFNAIISKVNFTISLDDFPAKTIEFFYCKFENTAGIISEAKAVIFRNTVFNNITPFSESKDAILEIGNCKLFDCQFLNCTASQNFIFIGEGNIRNCLFAQCSGVNMKAQYVQVNITFTMCPAAKGLPGIVAKEVGLK